jgi:hypothetical protein
MSYFCACLSSLALSLSVRSAVAFSTPKPNRTLLPSSSGLRRRRRRCGEDDHPGALLHLRKGNMLLPTWLQFTRPQRRRSVRVTSLFYLGFESPRPATYSSLPLWACCAHARHDSSSSLAWVPAASSRLWLRSMARLWGCAIVHLFLPVVADCY